MTARRRLLNLMLQYKWSYLCGLFMVAVSNIAFVAPPLILGFVVDAFEIVRAPFAGANYGESGAAAATNWAVVWLGAAAILGFFAIRGLSLYLMRRLVVTNSRRVEADLRRDIFAKLGSLSFSYFNKMRIGDVMTRATSDTEQVRMVAGPAMMFAASSILNLALVLGIYFYLSWKLAFFMLIPFGGMIVTVTAVFRKLRESSIAVREHYSRISQRARESFAGMRVLKSFAQEDEESARFDGLSRGYMKKILRLFAYDGGLRGFIIFFSGLGMFIILLVGAWLISTNQMSHGNMATFIWLQLKMTWPLMVFGWVAVLYQRGMVSMERINEILAAEPEIGDAPGVGPFDVTEGRIEYRGVRFEYDPERGEILHGIDLKIPAGSTVAVVGGTASGKSTLISLLMRLFDPTEGEVEIDGRNVKTIPLRSLRAAVGYSPQEPFLFSDTLYNNISFAVPDATEAEVRAAVHDEIEGFADGYDTLVGERGVTVSGGQMQRLAIARAILRRPPILVLDDSLSSVDTRTEEEVLSGLAEVIEKGTSIIVTHRLTNSSKPLNRIRTSRKIRTKPRGPRRNRVPTTPRSRNSPIRKRASRSNRPSRLRHRTRRPAKSWTKNSARKNSGGFSKGARPRRSTKIGRNARAIKRHGNADEM